MSTQVRVFFAGEHEAKSREAVNQAWRGLADKKLNEVGRKIGHDRLLYHSSPYIGMAVQKLFKTRGFASHYGSPLIIPAPEACYICDLLCALSDVGQVSGSAVRRVFLCLFGFKEYVFKVILEVEDPLTAQANLEKRLSLMENCYPKFVSRRFSVEVDVVQPIDAAMVALQEGLAAIEAAH